MADLEGSVKVGETITGVCSGCNAERELRYEGVQQNPIRMTEVDSYTCLECRTTRGYNRRKIA